MICPIFNICGGSGGAESGASVRILRNLGYFKKWGVADSEHSEHSEHSESAEGADGVA